MKRIILSEEKLNALAEQIGQRLFESRYYQNGVIKGEELKDFTTHNQVNKFLLFQLFQILNLQMNRIKHPYFDFEQTDVQTTLTQLQNQLSRHIRIKQEDFKALVKKAVFNNLKLILDPIETLGNFFFHNQEKISIEMYEKYAPFFSDFDFAVNSIMRYHQKNGMKTVEKDIFFVKLQRVIAIYNSTEEKGIEHYRNEIIEQLSGKSIETLIEEARAEAEEKRAELLKKEEEAKKVAELNAAKAEEDAQKAAEEARLKQEAEEATKQKEESFFDTLNPKADSIFDIDESDDDNDSLPLSSEIIEIGTDLVENKEVASDNSSEKEEDDAPEIPTPEEDEIIRPELLAEITHEKAPEVAPPAKEEPKEEGTGIKVIPTKPVEIEKKVEAPAIPVEVAKKEPEVKVEEPKIEPIVANVPVAPVTIEPEKEEVVAPVTPLFERFFGKKPVDEIKTEGTNLLDRFKKIDTDGDGIPDEKNNLVESFAPKQIIDTYNAGQKIRLEDIQIHKQYMYVQRVFAGNNVRFRIIIDKANNANDKAEIEEIVQKYILSNPDVKEKDPIVEEFIKLLRGRFPL
jgi:hypothetical protein